MRKFSAGPISVHYDNGFLRRITYGESEVLRMIYFALRDHNWNTIPHQIENERIMTLEGGFEITYDCFHSNAGAKLIQWTVKIEGRPDGRIVFEISGRVLHNVKKNRAGFCVLHPLNTTNQPCTLTHPDDSKSIVVFPAMVSPDNPFKNIRSMRWSALGIEYKLSFEGDVFETEDQRNWCDASFKTFCTPLDKPFPVLLTEGESIFQRITFTPAAVLKPVFPPANVISLKDHGVSVSLPSMGIAASTEVARLSPELVTMLRSLQFAHYRIDLFPSQDNWVTSFSQQYEIAYSLALALEVVLHLTDDFRSELEGFVMVCQQNKVKVKKVLLLPHQGLVTTQQIIDQISSLKRTFPKVFFGAGTNYNFNELNKNRFNAEEVDFVSFSIDPQEHATDDLTVLENTEAMGHLVRSAKDIYGSSMAVHVSPVTLRKRFNPYATNPDDLFIEDSKKADPRQKEIFAAVWAFASICSLAKAGAEAITFFQTAGHQGIVSVDAEAYPVYHVLKKFAPFAGKPASILESSDPLRTQGIVIDKKILGLVNLTEEATEVLINYTKFNLAPFEVRFETLSGS